VTRTGPDGEYILPRLPAGTYMLVALRPLHGELSDEQAVQRALEVATGRHPESCLVGSTLETFDARGLIDYHAGLPITLGVPPDSGRRVAGRLQGTFQPDEYLYEVVAYAGRVSRHVLPDADGRFDAGWIPGGVHGLRVLALPYGRCELYNDAGTPVEHEPDARVVELPFHARVRLRVDGVDSFSFGELPRVKLMTAGMPWSDKPVASASGVLQTLREGETQVVAYADGRSSGIQTVTVSRHAVPHEVWLTLRP
jgi:hypothetical protein